MILLTMALALVAAACGEAEVVTETVIVEVEVPGDTVVVEVEVPAEGELVTLVARCRAKPPIEDGRCNNLLRGVVDANAELEASGDLRRVQVQIIQDNPDAGDYVTEFELASATGEAPDIIAAAHNNIGTWGASGIIADLTDLLGDYPEFDDITPSLWASTELNGRRYGVPLDAEARPLFFRKDLLAELDWTQAEIDSLPARLASGEYTWEDMFDTAEEAVAAGVVDPGFGWWPRPSNGPDFLYWYYAAGGGGLVDDSGALIYDKAAALKAYEIAGDAVSRNILVDTRLDGDWDSWHNGVALGNVLFWFAGSWQWAEWAELFVADLGGEEYLFENVGFGPIPALAGGANTPITLTNPFNYMVSSDTEHLDLAVLVISKATTKELNTESALLSGKLAILESQVDYEPYTSARFQSEMAPILEFTTFQPNSPFYSAWSEAYYLGIRAVISGEVTPEEAIELAVSQLEAELGDNVIIK
jgi:inositol-phosphate transport system substrate-binding protein